MPGENNPNFELNGKTAIITGAGGGIGLAVTEAYLEKGANCFACDIKESAGIKVLRDKFGERFSFSECDVTKSGDIARNVRNCLQYFGSIDILFNNAAIFGLAPLLESDEKDFDRLFAVNVKGMFFFMQAVAKVMTEKGNRGKIINLASQAGRRGEALVAHYCATKAAVISYTQSAALALAPAHINVNAISPGVIDTPMWEQVDALFARYENLKPGEKKRQVGLNVPLGYMGKPRDITGMAVFLASSASDYVTAQTFNVDGGNVMS